MEGRREEGRQPKAVFTSLGQCLLCPHRPTAPVVPSVGIITAREGQLLCKSPIIPIPFYCLHICQHIIEFGTAQCAPESPISNASLCPYQTPVAVGSPSTAPGSRILGDTDA